MSSVMERKIEELQRIAGHEALHPPLRNDAACIRNGRREVQNQRIGVDGGSYESGQHDGRGLRPMDPRPGAVRPVVRHCTRLYEGSLRKAILTCRVRSANRAR